MSTRIKSTLAALFLAASAFCCGGCRSDGQTTQIGYTYEGPMLMEAADRQTTPSEK